MADALEKSSKKLIDKYLKVKAPPATKKTSNYSNYNQNTENKEELK
jgi:hypothetical protein